jgi:hypothetical protein
MGLSPQGWTARSPGKPAYQPVAPAQSGQARQPARAAALGIPGGAPGALEGCIGTARSGQEPDERQQTRHQGRVLRADVPIARLPGGQRREGSPEMTLGRAVQAARPAKALPRSAHRPGHHLTPAQGRWWSRVGLRGQRGLAQVVCHHGKSRQEGVPIDHRIGSLSWGR